MSGLLDDIPTLPSRAFVASLYRAVLAGEVARDDVGRATAQWWETEATWSDDAVLLEAVTGLGFFDMRQPDGELMYPDEQVSEWLAALEAGRRPT